MIYSFKPIWVLQGEIYMKNVKNMFLEIWNDESGQGATEYILLLVVVVGIAMMFKDQIKSIVEEKIQGLGSSISSFE